MVRHKRGFILYIVCLWLMIAGMAALQSFSHSQMLVSVVHQQHAQLQLQRMAESILQQIEHALLQHREFPCTYNNHLSGSKKSIKWWRRHMVCHGKVADQQFDFVLEAINRQACLGGDAIYWRVSVYLAHRHDDIIIQSYVLSPEISDLVCKLPKNVDFGRQAWRVL